MQCNIKGTGTRNSVCIPSVNHFSHAKFRQLSCQVRHTVSAEVAVHVQEFLVGKLDKGLFEWVIDPAVHLRPDPLNYMILENNQSNMSISLVRMVQLF